MSATPEPAKAAATYLLVSHSGDRVTRHDSISAAIAHGARLDRGVSRATGGRGGMDCHIVRDQAGILSYRGMVCGRRVIGAGFGCAAHLIEQAQRGLREVPS